MILVWYLLRQMSVAWSLNGEKHAESDRIVPRHLASTTESAGLAGNSRGSSSFVPIVI